MMEMLWVPLMEHKTSAMKRYGFPYRHPKSTLLDPPLTRVQRLCLPS
jgi:hypothetical protein